MHFCRVMILSASWNRGGMAPMSGVLEWKDKGSLGSAGRGDTDRVSLSMSMTS